MPKSLESLSVSQDTVEYVRRPDASYFVSIPDEVSETWGQDFTTIFGGERFVATITAEDWLVQRLHEGGFPISSADYLLEDMMNHDERNWRQQIRGVVWDAGRTPTPQYSQRKTRPVISLLDAHLVRGERSLPLTDDPNHLVLVCLDNRYGGIEIIERDDGLPPQAA